MSHTTESMILLGASYTLLVPCVLNQVVSFPDNTSCLPTDCEEEGLLSEPKSQHCFFFFLTWYAIPLFIISRIKKKQNNEIDCFSNLHSLKNKVFLISMANMNNASPDYKTI